MQKIHIQYKGDRMKVYVVIDNDTNIIINVHATMESAQKELNIKPDYRTIREYNVINTDTTKMKSIAEVNKKVYDPLHFNDVMPYGKYRGQTIGTIIQSDPEYLQWCKDNCSLSLDEDCNGLIEASLEKQCT